GDESGGQLDAKAPGSLEGLLRAKIRPAARQADLLVTHPGRGAPTWSRHCGTAPPGPVRSPRGSPLAPWTIRTRLAAGPRTHERVFLPYKSRPGKNLSRGNRL